jgi:serine/threonine-protein kinase
MTAGSAHSALTPPRWFGSIYQLSFMMVSWTAVSTASRVPRCRGIVAALELSLKKLGKYELVGELGRGAFGIVYRARDPILNRSVALKTLTSGIPNDPQVLERFYREARSAAALQHPNVVTIYDLGHEGSIPFIAMELVDGQNLTELIANRAALPLALRLAYSVQAGRAFDYAHKRGIIHRDIKPGNVMVTKDDAVKVVDFGIARVIKASNTQTGAFVGTFAYMAPELFHGARACERTDLWSFGALLYELLAYEAPFSGVSPAALMQVICNQEPVPLRQRIPECPEDLEALVHRALRKSEAERYQKMDELLVELEPIWRRLQAESVAAMLEQARELIGKNEFAAALKSLREALRLDSTNVQAKVLSDEVNAELSRLPGKQSAQQHKARSIVREASPQSVKQSPTGERGNELTLANIDRAARMLARYIGPISGVLTQKAAQRSDTLRALYLLLAENVDSATERTRFLREAGFSEPS